MKEKQVWLVIFILILCGVHFPREKTEKIILENPIQFEKKMFKNNIFLKNCPSYDLADGFFYFLDTHFGMVFKVDQETGKLERTISSKGQGPSEIQYGTGIRVKKNKVFILDSGFNGIKIFDTQGNIIKEIRLTVVIRRGNIDVNDKEEIFVGRVDTQNNKLVSVYNLKGEKLRSIVPIETSRNVNRLSKSWYYYIRLDESNNIYILFYMKRKLAKYDSNGNLLWEKPIKNELLDQFPDDDKVSRDSAKTIVKEWRIFGFDVTPGDNVIISHAGGGCMFSGDGNLKKLFTREGEKSLHNIRVRGNQLINLSRRGEIVSIYQFKEEK